MTDLYRRSGSAPAPLPFEAYDTNGRLWTDLANSEDGRSACGFVKAPKRPSDTDAQVAKWDAVAEKWVMVDRSPSDVDPSSPFGTISDRQFFQALASEPYHLITPQEALDAVKTGEIPAVMQAVIDMMPAAQQFPATMLVAGATNFERDNPLVAVFAASQNMDAAAVDGLWRFAEAL